MILDLRHTDGILMSLFRRIATAFRQVPRVSVAGGTTDATPGTPFNIKHGLGVKPQAYFYNSGATLHLTHTAADKIQWSDTDIVLRGDVANTDFTLVVMGDL